MQYIQVKLLNGFPQPLTYKVPENCHENLVGTVVRVPLKDRVTSAYVFAQSSNFDARNTFVIKEMLCKEPFPADKHYKTFVAQLSHYYQIEPIHFIKRIKQFVNQDSDDAYATVLNTSDEPQHEKITLTPEQKYIVEVLATTLPEKKFSPSLLHGVTGSGKTEVYKELIIANFNAGKTTMLLLPEVSLAVRFEQLLKKQLPSTIPLFGFHSATKSKEKKNAWNGLLESKPLLIIGVHLPVLLPIANLGLIIIDEEHETGYQEKKHPKVNSKEAALLRAQLYQIPILLGSATPSIATLHSAQTKSWNIFNLHQRFGGSFPTIKTVFLTNKEERRSNFWITRELQNAIAQRLQKKEQTIIFLNRRGYSFFVQCKECSFIFECTSCSVSLTLHENRELACHYCSVRKILPLDCPSCKRSDSLLKKGIGTQQVVTILQKIFPTARIARADMDVTSKKEGWQTILKDFDSGALDILVGTQTITKGFHFPKVTLVGILWADLNLHFPVYNAAETCLQQLIQVAGRAGRAQAESVVIVQTMMKHPIFEYLNEVRYRDYYNFECQNRMAVSYPPFIRWVEIELKNNDEESIERESLHLSQFIRGAAQEKKIDVDILGPAKPPVAKIKNTYSRKIYIKGSSINTIISLYRLIDQRRYKSSIFFTPNPSTG